MPEPSDRRTSERFPVTADTTCSFASPVIEDFGPVKIKNLSTDGLGMFVGYRLEPGDLLAITLSNSKKNFVKTLLVRVAHVTAMPGTFLVGGTFTTPLTYEELTKLVM